MQDALAPAEFGGQSATNIRTNARGQQVMSRYLEGEEVPQTKADFSRCTRWFAEAAKLSPAPAFDNSRAQFCEGRALIFDKQYDNAEKLLNMKFG